MQIDEIRLPKQVELDARGEQILKNLIDHSRPIWALSRLRVPAAKMTPEIESILKRANVSGEIIRGLEQAEKKLSEEMRGMRISDRRTGVKRGKRISRLLIISNDGAERFYRHVEALLNAHSPRILAVIMEIDAETLGSMIYGPGKRARLIMLDHKDVVSDCLLAIDEQWL